MLKVKEYLASGYCGLQPTSEGLHSSSDGLQPTSDDTRSEAITFLRSEAIVFLRSETTTTRQTGWLFKAILFVGSFLSAKTSRSPWPLLVIWLWSPSTVTSHKNTRKANLSKPSLLVLHGCRELPRASFGVRQLIQLEGAESIFNQHEARSRSIFTQLTHPTAVGAFLDVVASSAKQPPFQ